MADALSDRSLYALALLYLACSQATDGDLGQAEVDAAGDRIRAWRPDVSAPVIGSILAKALEVYRSTLGNADRTGRIAACAAVVRRDVGADRLPRVMADLRAIVEADGLVSEGEDEFLAVVERAFGLVEPG
jgi:hypothetical protein